MKTTDAYKWLGLRLREAARTIKLLRLARHDIPDSVKSAWPNYARAIEDAYGYEGDPEHPLIPKDTDEQRRRREDRLNRRVFAMQASRIQRMLEVLGWMLWLEPDEKQITWRRAEGDSWADIKDHRSIRTLQRIRDRALGAILIRLYG
ncbi:MAG: DUF6362 family protein [Nitrospiraceae bacterium]